MKLALVIEYEGTQYSGFQYQDNAPSIQEELEKAITKLTGEELRVAGAGRTDAGVHAEGQVVAFETSSGYSPDVFQKALNHYLPDEIAVKAAYGTSGDFDPRRMALSRWYRYTIDRGDTPSPLKRRINYHLSDKLDVDEMRVAASMFLGVHDFSCFATSLGNIKASTFREVYMADVLQTGDTMVIDIKANSFLPHQVRRMAGSLIDIGKGILRPGDLASMLDGKCEDTASIRTLPSVGLCLLEVTYPDFPPGIGKHNDY